MALDCTYFFHRGLMRKYLSSNHSWWGALLILCITMGAISPAVAQLRTEAGECYYLQRDRLLEALKNEPNDDVNLQNVHFFVEISDQDAALSSTTLEDLKTQLIAAEILYREVLGLVPPLLMPRYQNANFVMVMLRADQASRGQAYDEVVRSDVLPNCHIRMALGGQIDAARNLTPAHELFHLYQNAYMMFKQGWMYEGLARWSESLLRGDVSKGQPLPANVEALEMIMQESYGAASFWQRLFYLLDPQGDISIPVALQHKRYYDGGIVVAATELYGREFLRLLFSSLNEVGEVLAQQEQWSLYGWPEAEQRNLRHNEIILSAVHHAVSAYLPIADQPDELRNFMQLIEPMVDQ